MQDNKSNFLESIEFQEDFPPFKKGNPIKFGGEKEVQRMIEFYLKNKGIENYKENAQRFKINCVLGNNGGGKSRLFRGILNYRSENFQNYHELDSSIKLNTTLNDTLHTEIILDDCYIMGSNFGRSVHNGIIGGNSLSYYRFLFKTYHFFSKNLTLHKMFSEFLHVELNNKKLININLRINFQIEKKFTIFPDLLKKYRDKYMWSGINSNEFENFISTISDAKGFHGTFVDSPEINKFGNIKQLLKENINFFYIFIITSGILKTKLYELNDRYNFSNEKDINYRNDREISISFYHFIKSIISDFNDERIVFLEEIKDIKQDEDLKNIFQILYGKIENKINIFDNNKKVNILKPQNFSGREVKYFSSHFNIEATFGGKEFFNLSAGEQLNFMRFTNTFIQIEEEHNKAIKDYFILIDEPDLHLHLDWQRQYIQKLIDVFSTLDSKINLHFIIATHSPFIISDLPKESLVLLENGEQIEYEGETFGANYIDIIKNGFFFDKKKFMGSFAEEVIGEVAQSKRKELMDIPDDNDKELMYEIEKNIGDKFLKNNLVYFKSKKYDKSGN